MEEGSGGSRGGGEGHGELQAPERGGAGGGGGGVGVEGALVTTAEQLKKLIDTVNPVGVKKLIPYQLKELKNNSLWM